MELKNIERALKEQKEELSALRDATLVDRAEQKKINLNSKLAQVVIGVRRSGKSTLCFKALEKAGVNYAYVNFDDERLANLTAEDWDKVLETLYRFYGSFEYLFLDEVQNVESWPLFVNRMLRQGMHVLLTGSNAKLLSTDLATHLTGRHHQIELFPFSFRDWCNVKNVSTDFGSAKSDGLLKAAFDEYLRSGGFPELIHEKDSRDYIDSLMNSIIVQDIKHRFRVSNIEELRLMASHVLNETPTIVSKGALMEVCGLKSQHSVVKYLSCIRQTYLVAAVNRYSAKSRQRIRNEKYYAIDVAFMDKRASAFAGPNLGWRLETLVYLELRRKYSSADTDIYYYKEKGAEADFVVCYGNRTIAVYQVSYDISSPRTRAREIRGSIAAAKATRCDNLYLITENEYEDVVKDGYKIKIRPAFSWMLDTKIGLDTDAK